MSVLFIQEILTSHPKWAKQVITKPELKMIHIYILILYFTAGCEPISNGFQHFILTTSIKNPETLQP